MITARWLAAAAVTLLGACAQRVLVPEIMLDNLDQRRAEARKETKPHVEIIEVPKPLPLPGQLKPLPKKDAAHKEKSTPTAPSKKIDAANTAAKVEPSSDGFINAIQVYPYTKGALYQLYGAVKAIVLWFPKDRIAFANGWVVMLGALGAVSATLPAEPLVNELGWRGLFALLAAATALTAAVMLLVVPEPPKPVRASPLARVRLRDIYRDIRFLRLAPLSTLCIGTAWSLQGLWAAPWLEHAEGLDRDAIVRHLLIMGLALSGSAVLLGWSADRLRRRGLGREAFYAVIAIAFIVAQMMLILRLPVPPFVPWTIIAAMGAATVLSFAILPEYFPKEMSARANAALNILHLSGAFVLQYLTGVIVSLWPAVAGHPPAEAYEAAFGLSVVLQLITLLWFLGTARLATVPTFLATRQPARQATATAPRHHGAQLNYLNAGLVVATHIARARSQAAHWRLIGIASAALCASLATLVALGAHSAAIVHVVETPSRMANHADSDMEGAKPLIVSITYRNGRDMP